MENATAIAVSLTHLTPLARPVSRALITAAESAVRHSAVIYGGGTVGTDANDVMDVQFPSYFNAIAYGRDRDLLQFMSLTFPERDANLGGRVTISFALPSIAAHHEATLKGGTL